MVKITRADGSSVTDNIGITLSVERVQVRVSSDHAWIDSGNRLRETYWDGRYVQTVDHHTDDTNVQVEADATEEVRADVELFRKVEKCFGQVQTAYAALVRPVIVGKSGNYWSSGADLTNIVRGDKVEVYAGRKCPKGIYEVVRTGQGNYGPYVDLRDASGRTYTYINPDNIRRPAPTDQDLWNCIPDVTKPAAPFVFGILKEKNHVSGWLALCDQFEEDPKTERFGEMLRNIVHRHFQTEEYKAIRGAAWAV